MLHDPPLIVLYDSLFIDYIITLIYAIIMGRAFRETFISFNFRSIHVQRF